MTGVHGCVVAVAGILVLAGCSEHRNIASVWSTRAVTIDGKGSEWTDVPLDYFEEGDASWGIMNDADNLYLIVGSSNKSSIRTLRQSGLTLWFNNTGEKNKREFGLRMRSGATTWTPPRTDEQTEGRPPEEGRPATYDSFAMALDLTAIDNKGHEAPISRSGEDGPVGAAGCDEAICSYELSIPIKRPGAMVGYALTVSPGGKIGIGVELNVPKKSRRQLSGDESLEMDEVGEGRRHRGGGSRGGVDRGDRGKNEPPKPLELEKKEIWLSVTLATRPLNQDANQK